VRLLIIFAYCVTVMVSVAAWLIAPAPLVDADTDRLVVPMGVPGFPLPELPPLHEVNAETAVRSISSTKSRKLRDPRLRRAAKPNITARTGNKTA
jgi:hypothetical protein